IANLVDCLHLTQLQPEHVELLKDRKAVLVVDCAHQQDEFITLKRITPTVTPYFSSHIVPPDVLLGWYQQLIASPGPECYLLSIRGEQFELGQPLSAAVEQALPLLRTHILRWIDQLPHTRGFA
ncbi:MAG TPA: hypothetical protein VFM46_11310, partial [Pseudomonadales bacterium]|nr:hypothetical protein [Pseudomonadales bacterium]